MAWKETHRPYGEKHQPSLAGASNTIGFAGKPFDNATGLSYMGARYYNPILGRFTGIDPVGFTQANLHSHNRYTYANNNPFKFVDPDGRMSKPPADKGLFGGWGGGGPGFGGGFGGMRGSSGAAAVKGNGTVASTANNSAASVNTNVAPSAAASRSHQTYTKENSKTGEVYSGRCSGCKTAEENVSKRDATHHMTEKGFGPAQLDKSSTSRDAIRGREQQMIEANGGAKSVNGTSGNAINGISPANPKGNGYRGAANEAFGEIK